MAPKSESTSRNTDITLASLRQMCSRTGTFSPLAHLFESLGGHYAFVADHSQVFRIGREDAAMLAAAMEQPSDAAVSKGLAAMGIPQHPPLVQLETHSLTSISLAVAQKCNLGCTYCYAQEGDFGGAARSMTLDTAKASIDRLLENSRRGEAVNLSFLGGEPLVNRDVLRASTEYAVRQSRALGVDVRFSITTNGTLLTESDADFFERHGFAVTVSVDGIGETHDRLRPFKSGRGSFEQVVEKVMLLLSRQREMQVSARVTVTPANLHLLDTLNTLIQIGFHSVGFSPMLSSPGGRDEMDIPDLDRMLEEMTSCGREFERHLTAGKRYPFANMTTAMMEIHRGTHRPYPCGAGAGYMGASADGGLFACHRFVDDDTGEMGDVRTGVNAGRQKQWLMSRHVDAQEPCKECWARYLCGGGCHHEVIHRGRPACDFIRGWLHYCLQAYVRLLAAVPGYFGKDRANGDLRGDRE